MEKQSHEMFGPARRKTKAFKDLPPVQWGRGIPCRLGSFRRDGRYLLPPLRVFDPTVSAISIKRRMASARAIRGSETYSWISFLSGLLTRQAGLVVLQWHYGQGSVREGGLKIGCPIW